MVGCCQGGGVVVDNVGIGGFYRFCAGTQTQGITPVKHIPYHRSVSQNSVVLTVRLCSIEMDLEIKFCHLFLKVCSQAE